MPKRRTDREPRRAPWPISDVAVAEKPTFTPLQSLDVVIAPSLRRLIERKMREVPKRNVVRHERFSAQLENLMSSYMRQQLTTVLRFPLVRPPPTSGLREEQQQAARPAVTGGAGYPVLAVRWLKHVLAMVETTSPPSLSTLSNTGLTAGGFVG
ncbi:type I restriction enzyme endonuclease domain-containing protein [Micromonospora sp. DT229]|uniref:type I restriction enzyme endonuclease domain-containing protein n=1 Tax=Micromonospora sp. DT229 TaxID=3393430 RepID=UPI003CE8FC07